MVTIHLDAAWVGVLLGCLAGVAAGLFFDRQDWLGGYGSWQRRMTRLGHISFFGLAAINFAFAITVETLDLSGGLAVPSVLLLVGAATMPAVCYLSAASKAFRHLFFIPAGSVTIAVAMIVGRMLMP